MYVERCLCRACSAPLLSVTRLSARRCPSTADGNTYLPGINAVAPSKVHAVRGYQLFFAVVYSVCIAFAVSGMSFSLQCAHNVKYQSYYQADISFQAFCIYFPLGLLALGSTLHIMPEGPPFSYLLWWFRVGSLFQLIVQIFDFAAGIEGFCEKMGDDD